MAKRNRYRELESMMIKGLLGVSLLLIAYLVFAGMGIAAMKVITSILTILGSLLALAWLVLTGEFTRRRSLWMVTAFICILLLVVVSLLLGYPCPGVTAPGTAG